MSRRRSPFRQYLESSRHLHYGLIITLPALLVYELGIFILFKNAVYELRNSGEILIRQLFHQVGIHDITIISALLTLVFIVTMVYGYRKDDRQGIRANYLVFMLVESLMWGGLLAVIMKLYTRLPLQILTLEDKLANINLAIGAGIFEELIFRMILISALAIILEFGLRQEGRRVELISVTGAAVIFAMFHLFLEPYSFPVFMQRVLGGIYLGYLYRLRGYGIAVYAHIVFNLTVLADTW